MEIWKDIKGHEGHHQISNLGRVRSIERIVSNSLGTQQLCEGKIIKPSIDRYGYKKIALRINGKRKYYTIHRLVCLHFIPNIMNKPQVNHIDENKLNNVFTNLEWATAKENANHNGLPKRRAKKLWKKISLFDLEGNFIKHYPSMIDSEKDGFDRKKVSACCTGNRKTHKNHRFSYA